MKIRGSLTFKVTRDPAAKRSQDPCMWRRKASWKLRDLEARVPERRMVKVMGTGVNYTPGMSIQTNYEGLPNLPLVSFLVSPSAWNILIISSYLKPFRKICSESELKWVKFVQRHHEKKSTRKQKEEEEKWKGTIFLNKVTNQDPSL